MPEFGDDFLEEEQRIICRWWSRWDCFWLFEENPRKTAKY
jgi:hypothetical protein